MPAKVSAFISASFADEAQPTIEWFLRIAEKLGFDPVWLRRRHQARPVKEKIKTAMKECPAFVQIPTHALTTINAEITSPTHTSRLATATPPPRERP